jgi:hypothetical protein
MNAKNSLQHREIYEQTKSMIERTSCNIMGLFYLQLGAIETPDEVGRCGLTWTHTRQSRISHIESIAEEGSLLPHPGSKGAEPPAD